jgi:chromosome segregation ATPase
VIRAWIRRWLGWGAVEELQDEFCKLDGRLDDLKREQARTETLRQALADERASFVARLTAVENSAAAANSRAERLETALARLEGRVRELEGVSGLNVRFVPRSAVDSARSGSEMTASSEVTL